MFDLRNVFQLVDDRFGDRSFSEQDLIEDRHEFVFHIRFDTNNELDIEVAQEFFEKRLRDVAAVTDQFAEKTAHQFRYRFSIIHIASKLLTFFLAAIR